jgi:flagellar biosynthesis/type III secretory pathway chaperone
MSRGGSSLLHLPQHNSSNVVLHQDPNRRSEQWMNLCFKNHASALYNATGRKL